jgi:S-methylmethionine-dependent homocysteine/selenocysteine methylase
MSSLSERLAQKEVVLIDGGVGTDLELLGVPMTPGAWCGGIALTHPKELLQVHMAHIQAGAQLIIANTYASSRHVLAQAGLGEDFEALNRLGVEIALDARAKTGADNVVVAGSISTTDQGGEFPDPATALANFKDQARILADAGAELIILEMMRDTARTMLALQAAVGTGLPIWVGLSCIIVDNEPYMMLGTDKLADTLIALEGHPIEAMAIMHTEVQDTNACLDVLQEHWYGPVGVYAQTGEWINPNWQFTNTISHADYAEACRRWVDRGVQIIGGCCGITDAHIAQLRDSLPSAISR